MSFNQYEKNRLLELLDVFKEHVKSIEVKKDCYSCQNFTNDICKIAGKRPPENVIKQGCELYFWDNLTPPF